VLIIADLESPTPPYEPALRNAREFIVVITASYVSSSFERPQELRRSTGIEITNLRDLVR
jgi:hypothetical protein